MFASRYRLSTYLREFVLLIGVVIVAIPIYVVIVVSLKSDQEAALDPFSLAFAPTLDSYAAAWQGGAGMSMPMAILNSLILTVGTVIGVVGLGSLAAYAIARRASRMTGAMYAFFVMGIIVPYQIGVVPTYVAMQGLGIVGTYLGTILLYVGIEMPFAVFLYVGFIRALPRDYEEAAQLDGAGRFRSFRSVVFPLLAPVTVTVAILTAVSVWNDFFLQLIFTSGSDVQTLPVTLYSFVAENTLSWNRVFAGATIAMLPLLIFYLLAQRQVVRAFAGGIRG